MIGIISPVVKQRTLYIEGEIFSEDFVSNRNYVDIHKIVKKSMLNIILQNTLSP